MLPGFLGQENVKRICILGIHLRQKPESKVCQIREGNLTLTTLSLIVGYITYLFKKMTSEFLDVEIGRKYKKHKFDKKF